MSIIRNGGALRLAVMIAIALLVGIVAYFGIVRRSVAPTPLPPVPEKQGNVIEP